MAGKKKSKKKSAKKVASKIHALCSQRSDIQKELERHQKAMSTGLKKLATAEKKAADLVKKAEAAHKAKREREEKRFAKEIAELGGPCKPRKAGKKRTKSAAPKVSKAPKKASKKTSKRGGAKRSKAQVDEHMAKMRAARMAKARK